jgi:hypothetical protein
VGLGDGEVLDGDVLWAEAPLERRPQGRAGDELIVADDREVLELALAREPIGPASGAVRLGGEGQLSRAGPRRQLLEVDALLRHLE